MSVGMDNKRTRGHPPSVWKIMEVCIHIYIYIHIYLYSISISKYIYINIYHSFFFLKSLVISLRVSL